MLSEFAPICFVATTDVKRSRKFYEETLGLQCRADDASGLVFELHGSTLRVQKSDSFEPHPHTVHGWRVTEIRSLAETLIDKGVELLRFPCFEQDEIGIWNRPGIKIAWFADPDGNILSLSELG